MDLMTVQKGSAKIPEAEHQIEPTLSAQLDQALALLQDRKQVWADLPIKRRIKILETILETTLEVSQPWIDAALEAKGIEPGTAAEGEEWLGGPALVIRNIKLLIKSLRDIEAEGLPKLPAKPTELEGGQVAASVFPVDVWDKILFGGLRAEVRMQKSVSLENFNEHQASFYANPKPQGKVNLVLGAGNVASIGSMDALYKLFVEGQVVILKMNPVNEYLGPFIEKAFARLCEDGFLRVVYGGVKEGVYLCDHELVDEIHITGSDKTHDAIVFGPGRIGEENKTRRKPQNVKPITSELGNVTPIIVVPGIWSIDDVKYQGVNLASSLCNNAGFNCNATRMIVQHEGWSQREVLLHALRDVFRDTKPRAPYYPGAHDRFRSFANAHPVAERFGDANEGRVPWTLIPDLDPRDVDDICFNTEAFCAVTGEVGIKAESVVEYIERAVEFCNTTLWGTLSASIIVHPNSLKDPAIEQAVEKAITDLRYGAVAVNQWSALAYGLVTPTWGAFPGHDIYDIQSGKGVVHNTYLFDKPEKSVIRGAFRIKPKPAWFVTHRQAAALGKKLTHFYAHPSWGKLPSLLWSALRG